MDLLLPLATQQLPLFNRLLLIPINFMTAALVLTVMNHNGLKDRKGKIFIVMGLFILAWVDFAYLARRIGEASLITSELFLRSAWIATPPVFFVAYWLSITLVAKNEQYDTLTKILLILTLFSSAITALTPLIIKNAVIQEGQIDIQYGMGFFPFLAFILALMAATIYPILKTKLNAAHISFLVGLLIFYLANFIFNITLPVFFGITHLYYLGDYSTIFLLIFTAYSIIRHKLFDIKVFGTEIVTFIILSILLVELSIPQSIRDIFVDGIAFVVTLLFGILLIRSVKKEVEQKEQLEELNKKLEDMDERKDEFLSVAAHELRAPMTAIKGYLSMINDGEAGQLTPKAKDYLKSAINANERLIRLVNNMLNVNRIEEGRLIYEMGIVYLEDVVKESFKEYEVQAKEKDLKYQLNIQPEVNSRIYVDKDRIHEVVSNFISNAIKYTDKGKVQVVLNQTDPNIIHFEVRDTGRGLSENEKYKVFQKFYRAHSNLGKQMGTGLGLYISKLLIQRFRGRLGVESEKDKGSTFWFDLPIT